MMNLTEQDIINLTNKAKREAILKAWKEWPVWASVPEIGLTVHKLDLPQGKAITAAVYDGDTFDLCGERHHAHPMFHLIGYGGKLASGSQGETTLISALQYLRQDLMEAEK